MSEGPQYTNCTDKADWKDGFPDAVGGADIGGAVAAILAIIAGILLPGAGVALAAGVVLAFAATAEIIRKVAEWQLNTKLICLKNVQRRVFTDPLVPRFTGCRMTVTRSGYSSWAVPSAEPLSTTRISCVGG